MARFHVTIGSEPVIVSRVQREPRVYKVNPHKPHLSIGMPVYNGEPFLTETLDSILAQTYADFELIISDNASTDQTEAICRDYVAKDPRIRYYRSEKNLGAAWNYNRVFELSQGEYFKWAAHDDTYACTFLEKCIAALDEDDSLVLSFSKTRFIDEQGQFLYDYDYTLNIGSPKPHERFFALVGRSHIITEVFGVIRVRILKMTPLIGNYVGSDRVLLGKLALFGPFYQVPEPLFFHREHLQRSTKAYTTGTAQAEWFDPANKGRIVLPHWRHFRENFFSIIHSKKELGQKVFMLALLCRLAIVSWERLIKELQIAVLQILRNHESPNWLIRIVDRGFNLVRQVVQPVYRSLRWTKKSLRRATNRR